MNKQTYVFMIFMILPGVVFAAEDASAQDKIVKLELELAQSQEKIRLLEQEKADERRALRTLASTIMLPQHSLDIVYDPASKPRAIFEEGKAFYWRLADKLVRTDFEARKYYAENAALRDLLAEPKKCFGKKSKTHEQILEEAYKVRMRFDADEDKRAVNAILGIREGTRGGLIHC